ncbi:excisionase family DNA-binding protein [Pseudooceanicola spongiae]|uniref:Helix-turn-helix domain-containing protein n=1 Tax=Pseudooceanicola spongiae TaxID=2613965 RepID=A0A7L9WQ04_9RHOB|nr:helix-turn-helix domain-containing protein [Pseudooceanicola spongiae]
MIGTRPFTPDGLAERWGCSGETVRNMIRDGMLPAFRVRRMYRIRPEIVEG